MGDFVIGESFGDLLSYRAIAARCEAAPPITNQ
jgi:hypothetical protein